ncbi:MAG: ABC transporter substrate-binding protein [Blastochloris sp.]|nr:ABC transporter substrate-binding protein [Blastochloris sp.]
MGSLEGAQALLGGDTRIHVWSPASALYKDTFVQDWQVKHSSNPILREEPLALSPMVFVFWDDRYEAFIKKYNTVNFDTIGQALSAPGGWDGIAGKPEWGLFKFAHTHPNESNSGLMTLVLMAHEFYKKPQGLSMKNILAPEFQTWMNGIERGVSGFSNSTGNMMREMVLKGPASYDALFVYESVVIDYLKSARGRWGELRVTYPQLNMWNDNPYYVLDTPWSSKDHQKAAGIFLDFLVSEPIQKQSLVHGFRPGNPIVPIMEPDSPFVVHAASGLKIDIGQNCESPKAETINNLLASWQRSQGSR